jgi:hypothetical protein
MRLVYVAPLVLAAMGVAGCQPTRLDDLLVSCPTLSLPADLADLTRYRDGAPPDLTTVVLDAKITGVDANCRRGRRDQSVDATISMRFQLDRGPAAPTRQVQIPWFIALLDANNNVINRQSFVLPAQFGANTTRAAVGSQPVQITFPVGQERRAQDYRIMVGFQLTESELALNRRRGPR